MHISINKVPLNGIAAADKHPMTGLPFSHFVPAISRRPAHSGVALQVAAPALPPVGAAAPSMIEASTEIPRKLT